MTMSIITIYSKVINKGQLKVKYFLSLCDETTTKRLKPITKILKTTTT